MSDPNVPDFSALEGGLLVRPEPDGLQAAADEEETARLRAQIAAEMPGLAAITAAHHGTTYDMPASPVVENRA